MRKPVWQENLRPPVARLVEVWDLPVRVFNIAILFVFMAALFTSGTGSPWHAISGATLLVLALFRIVWGFFGSDYSRFASFVSWPGTILQHVGRVFEGRGRRFLGHDPLTGGLLLVFLLLLLIIAGTGLMLRHGTLTDGGAFGLHAVLADVGLLVLAAGVLLTIFESWRSGENLVAAMITGRKRWQPGFAGIENWPKPVRDRVRSSEALALLALSAVLATLWWPLAFGNAGSVYGPEWAAAPRDVDFEQAGTVALDGDLAVYAAGFGARRDYRVSEVQRSSEEQAIVIAGAVPAAVGPESAAVAAAAGITGGALGLDLSGDTAGANEPVVADSNLDPAGPGADLPAGSVVASDELAAGGVPALDPALANRPESLQRSGPRQGGSVGVLGARERSAIEQTVVADSAFDQVSPGQLPLDEFLYEPVDEFPYENVPDAALNPGDAIKVAAKAADESAGAAATGEGEPVFSESPAVPPAAEVTPQPAAKGGLFDFLKRFRRKPVVEPFPGLAVTIRDATVYTAGSAAAVTLNDLPVDEAAASDAAALDGQAEALPPEDQAAGTDENPDAAAGVSASDASGEGLSADPALDEPAKVATPAKVKPVKLSSKRSLKSGSTPAAVVDAELGGAGLEADTGGAAAADKKRGPARLKGPRPPVAKAPKPTRRKPRDKNS